MPYTAPTVTDFQTRFPEFESVDDEVIESAITEANRFVDEEWVEADYQIAILLLAAHYVQSAGGSYDTGGLQSISVGSISVTYALGGSVAELKKTSYGERFLRIRAANRRGPRVA